MNGKVCAVASLLNQCQLAALRWRDQSFWGSSALKFYCLDFRSTDLVCVFAKMDKNMSSGGIGVKALVESFWSSISESEIGDVFSSHINSGTV